MNAAKPALTPEQRSFLEALFKDDAAFEEDALRVYASDASLRRGPVLAMVRPRTVEQVRELMRWAEVERIPIHPRGRGTSLSGGCVPTRAGVVVSMLGMDRIFDISSEDFVAVIEPGVNTLAFQQACEQKGLFYPPDPASGKATSVGGNVMTCAGGLRAVKYGVTRDYVLGMEAVLPGGKLLKLGGRTHKDAIGLDISRMFVGSEGTLGIGPCRLPLARCGAFLHEQGLRRRHPALCRGIHERNRTGNPVQNRRRAVAGYGQIAAAIPGGRQPGDGAAGKRPPRRTA